MLRPTDLFLCLYLAKSTEGAVGYEHIATHLDIGLASAHRSMGRLKLSGLLLPNRTVNRRGLLDLVVHGVRYVYYVKPGHPSRGVPTADAAPPLASIVSPGDAPPVWPHPEGQIRGYAVEPLHKSAPSLAKRDPDLYELLALVDAVRIGQARVRNLAEKELRQRLAR